MGMRQNLKCYTWQIKRRDGSEYPPLHTHKFLFITPYPIDPRLLPFAIATLIHAHYLLYIKILDPLYTKSACKHEKQQTERHHYTLDGERENINPKFYISNVRLRICSDLGGKQENCKYGEFLVLLTQKRNLFHDRGTMITTTTSLI